MYRNNSIKKILQNIFKSTSIKIFKILYGSITGKIKPEEDSRIKIKKTFLDKREYKVYSIKSGRLYTDRIHNTALIIDNKIIDGPSFQIRENIYYPPENNIVFEKGTPRIKKNLKASVASLLTGGGGNSNYWHWIFDVLPRIYMLEKTTGLNKIDFFLFPSLSEKFQMQTLDSLEISQKKRLTSLTFRHFLAEEILVPDHPWVKSDDPTKDSLNLPNWIMIWLKNKFLINIDKNDNKDLPKKFYIDRKDSKTPIDQRKIINEEETKKLFLNNGFKIVNLGKLNFVDQVKLFNNADIVAGLHGAGFANIVFCNPNTRVLELKVKTAGNIIKNLSEQNNLKYDCISADPENVITQNQQGDIYIPSKELKEKII